MYEDVLDQGSETFNIKTYLIPKMKIKLHIAKVLYSAVTGQGRSNHGRNVKCSNNVYVCVIDKKKKTYVFF